MKKSLKSALVMFFSFLYSPACFVLAAVGVFTYDRFISDGVDGGTLLIVFVCILFGFLSRIGNLLEELVGLGRPNTTVIKNVMAEPGECADTIWRGPIKRTNRSI